MTISNCSNISNLSLVTIQNITPLNFVVDSQFLPTVKLDIYNGTTPSDHKITSVELLQYETDNNSYYFTIDLRNILTTLFDTNSFDDIESGSNTWVTIPNSLFDVYVNATAFNGVDANVSTDIVFTICNASTDFGNDNIVTDSPLNLYDNTTNETYYAGVNNVVYLYQYCRKADSITITPDSDTAIFTDTNDTAFTDSNENILIE